MHQIKINNTKYTLPENWEELNPKRWAKIAPYVISDDIYTKEVLYELMTRKRFGIRQHINYSIINALEPGQLFDLYNCISWIKETPCTNPPFDSYRIGWKRFHLPEAEFMYMTVIEYAILDLCYQVYQRLWEGKHYELAEDWVCKLVSYMARPKDKSIDKSNPTTFNGEIREKFNTIICDRRLPLFRKTSMEFRYACLFYFVGVKRHIHNKYKATIFPSPMTDDGRIIEGISNKPPEPKEWLQIVFKLSGGKFGNLEATKNTNLYDVLEELEMQQLMNA